MSSECKQQNIARNEPLKNPFSRRFFSGVVLALVILLFSISADKTLAATYYWVGEGATTNTSDADNWSLTSVGR